MVTCVENELLNVLRDTYECFVRWESKSFESLSLFSNNLQFRKNYFRE